MKAIWQMWEAELSDDTINRIVEECEFYTPEKSRVGFREEGKEAEDEVRSSTVRWINPLDTGSKFIKDILMNYANLANRECFGVDINNIYDIQYTIYDAKEKGHYDYHFDTFWANPTHSDRKLSITIQLSDSNDYEGGDFLFDPQYVNPDREKLRKKGTVLVFPSPIRHCVETVTKGVRKSLVAWVEGPKWR